MTAMLNITLLYISTVIKFTTVYFYKGIIENQLHNVPVKADFWHFGALQARVFELGS